MKGQIEEKELTHISSYQTLSEAKILRAHKLRTKLEKKVGAPIGVKLLIQADLYTKFV